MTDDRIKVTTRKVAGGYQSKVTVDGEFYASVFHHSEAYAHSAATRYAAQIEFDEWGNW